ncbi:M23 family metallopeptidase [Alteromonas sp. KUL49]|uniref:M23 family metallopeptidase n=1 Tax=Alteromonas sp. KUL49 TaxID=2480798 RepID=UPI00102F20C6|nr:M23 family metallopeptidase [Alteromonas sp. KUL49]TAP40977.1 M23 family metallopeptidase [Alteromonas sp. KUL49]GEA11163.1 periplasmic metalloprotease M23B family protein [Alteromonas sp. KUL49]
MSKRVFSHFVWLPLAFVLISSFASADDVPLTLNGKLTQGSLVRGQIPPGASVYLDDKEIKVNAQGKFVVGFEREAELEHTFAVVTESGSRFVREFTLTERTYDIQRIDGLAQNMVSPPHAVLERIRRDGANVSKARSMVTDIDAVFTRFVWPAKGPITGVYGSQRVLNGVPKRPHFGVDVGGPTGTPVTAPAPGTVTLADDLYYSGNTVILDHGMGVFSTFLHLDTIAVSVGDKIKVGDAIGTIGETGRATGPHLDWRINLGTMRLDPETIVTGSPQ